MSRPDNYLRQAQQAKERFATYDQTALIAKLDLCHDDTYLYTTLFSQPYRIHRSSGDISRSRNGIWLDANSHAEVLTLLDLVCDSDPRRFVRGNWKNMSSFGLLFHEKLLEGTRDPWAETFEQNPDAFHRACRTLKGTPLPIGDIAYSIEVFDGLPLALQLWFGDDEFPASLRFLWDENALMYLKYETMFYAKELLLNRIREFM